MRSETATIENMNECKLCGSKYCADNHGAGIREDIAIREKKYYQIVCPVCLLGVRLSNGYHVLNRMV